MQPDRGRLLDHPPSRNGGEWRPSSKPNHRTALDQHLLPPQISQIDQIDNARPDRLPALIAQLLQREQPWASAFGALSPDEDLAKTYKFKVLTQAVPALTNDDDVPTNGKESDAKPGYKKITAEHCLDIINNDLPRIFWSLIIPAPPEETDKIAVISKRWFAHSGFRTDQGNLSCNEFFRRIANMELTPLNRTRNGLGKDVLPG